MSEDPPASGEATDHDAQSEPKLAIGEHVGRYELLGVLGEGGMSYVYLAHDPELDRDVALKLMRVRIGKEGARRLQREAQALARLSHPNVVPVYDAGLVGGQAFVAMEYVAGVTLRAWLKGDRTWRQILSVLVDAGKGLAAAHARGLIHRDFKPDNVLIGNDGRVRVLDFGLARLAGVLDGTISASVDSRPPSSTPIPPPSSSAPSSGGQLAGPEAFVTRADQLIGTPAYMAPEQVRREPVDERTDIFAFGVTLYEAFFGRRPFDTPQPAAPVGSAARTVTTSIDGANASTPRPVPRGSPVPRHVRRVVLRAIAYDPRNRWRSVDEMLVALARDPYRVWKRTGVAAAVAAAALASAGLVARERSKERALCHGGEERRSALWGPQAREKVRSSFAGTGLPYADDAVAAVEHALDTYTSALAERSDDACAATRLRGEQSEEAMDLRTACYVQRWREVGALVDLFQHADGDTVRKAAQAAQSLPPVDQCADVASLRATVPRPRGEAGAKVDALEQRLAAVAATYAVGKSTSAATMGDALVEDARQVGYVPLVAEGDFWRGRSYADLGDDDRSIPAFRAAFREALASRSDRVLRESAARLAQEYIYARQPAEFDYWADVAQAAIDRSGPDAALQSFLDHTRCVALWGSGKILSRLECLERHAAKVQTTRPLDEWELTTLGLAAVDAGQFDQSIEYARQGYEHALRTYGPKHPRTLEMRMYQCRVEIDRGDLDAALATCDATLHDLEEVAGDHQSLVGRCRLYLIDAFIRDRRYDDARSELPRAIATGADKGDAEAALARIDAATGHADRALPHFRQALAEVRDLPAEHPDVIGAKLGLGKALLDAGMLAEARLMLDDTMATAAHAELAPIARADVLFADARAIWATSPADRPRATDLARQALETYMRFAPPTRGFTYDRAEIEDWLAHPRL